MNDYIACVFRVLPDCKRLAFKGLYFIKTDGNFFKILPINNDVLISVFVSTLVAYALAMIIY